MYDCNINLRSDERISAALRALYGKHGYSQYKMSKFEEYDLYVRNKDFLISDSVITFTDIGGKLMALKPDVTLSIIKNSADDPSVTEKLYYNENVYRVGKSTHSFKEIMQVGLECIGNIDDYCICEVLILAAESLKTVSEDCVLDISHLGITSALVDSLCLPEHCRAKVLKCMGEKNLHEIYGMCEKYAGDRSAAENLQKLIGLYGSPDKVLPQLYDICPDICYDDIAQLERVCGALVECGCGDIVSIDFSVLNDMNYYNGIVFKGFVYGVPGGVLSGGQYDKLMKKMGRKTQALGFAVYLDSLQRMYKNEKPTDFDMLLLYSNGDDPQKVAAAAKKISDGGKSVMVQRSVPERLRFGAVYKYCDKGVKPIENA